MAKKKAAAPEPQGIIGDIIDDKVKSIRYRIRHGLRVEDIIDRLTSRKFWLTAIVLGYFMWRGTLVSNPNEIFGYLTQVIIAFLAIQGGSDALARIVEVRETKKAAQQNFNNFGELDPNVINAPINSILNNTINQPMENIPPGD